LGLKRVNYLETEHLRVLIANERKDRLALVAPIVAALGHEVIAREIGAKDWQSSIDIVLRRFAEYHELEGAFGRRAVTERAKGILMERHSIDDASAFEMLRDHSRNANRKLVDVAAAVVDGHRLLPKQPQAP
jgi:AmiR/NasT family two-component response regulator